jgi:NADH-quinone oxidoreductase subunit G
LGAGPDSLAEFVDHAPAKLERQIWIIGQGALAPPDGAAILSMAAKAAVAVGALKDGWNGFSVLHTAAARVGALDIGFVPGQGGKTAAQMAQGGALDVLFNLGADEIDVAPGAFVVYIGTHGDNGAHRADVILPGAAYTEKSGLYVNTEGRVQMAARANFPPGNAREDWAILRALSDVLGQKLPYDSLSVLRGTLFKAHPHLAQVDHIAPGNPADIEKLASLGSAPDKGPFRSPVTDFYLTNPVARASTVMAECSALARGERAVAAE